MSNDYFIETVKTLQTANKKIPIDLQIRINFQQIKANLDQGMKIAHIWQALTYEQKLNCSLRGFSRALKKLTKVEYSLIPDNSTSKEKESVSNNNSSLTNISRSNSSSNEATTKNNFQTVAPTERRMKKFPKYDDDIV